MKLKEKLISKLGGIGMFLYLILSVFISVFPLVMLRLPWLVDFLIISVVYFLPFLSPILSITALVVTINGEQDTWAIVYYVYFGLSMVWFIYYYATAILEYKKAHKTKNETPGTIKRKTFVIVTTVLVVSLISVVIYSTVTITNTTNQLAELVQDRDRFKKMFEDKFEAFESMNDRYLKLYDNYIEIKKSVEFMDDYIAIVFDDDDYYHRYGTPCYEKGGDFFAYNVENARHMGYHPCPACYD